MSDQELHAYCEQWRQWCWTRKYFLEPGAKNILARMQPARVGQPPNAELSADMSFFNMAVHALADMKEPGLECFVSFYFHRVKNIKVEAARLEIGRRTFYDQKMRFARRALSMSESLKRAHQRMPTEEVEAID